MINLVRTDASPKPTVTANKVTKGKIPECQTDTGIKTRYDRDVK